MSELKLLYIFKVYNFNIKNTKIFIMIYVIIIHTYDIQVVWNINVT